jgi:hypothetical protein
MNKYSWVYPAVLLLFAACAGRQNKIVGKWYAVSYTDKDMDSVLATQQHFLDTVGKGHDSVENMEMYGTTNIDSLKRDLQGKLDSAKALQIGAVTNVIFEFKKDGRALLNFGGGDDSCKWQLNEDKTLLLQMTSGDAHDNKKMNVLQLTDTVLVLSLQQAGDSTTITFHSQPK